MKKVLRIAAVAWLIPVVGGCIAGNDGPTMAEAGHSATMNSGVLIDTAASGDAVTTTTAGDSTGAERGGGSYGSGH